MLLRLNYRKNESVTASLNTNLASLYAQRGLSTSQTDLASSVRRLSSGQRINNGQDDVAGLSLSEGIKASKVITNQSIAGVRNMTSIVQIADGSLDVVDKILQRVLTLTISKQNNVLTLSQTDSVNEEIAGLLNQVSQIKDRTQFQNNDRSVYGSHLSFSSGAGTEATIDIGNLGLAEGTIKMTYQQYVNAFDFALIPGGAIAFLETSVYGVINSDWVGSSLWYGKHSRGVQGGIIISSVEQGFALGQAGSLVTITSDNLMANAQVFQEFFGAGYQNSFFSFGNGLNIVASKQIASNTARANGFVAYDDYFNLATGDIKNLTGTSVASLSSDNVLTAIEKNGLNRVDLGAWQNRLEYMIDNMQSLSNNLANAHSQLIDTDYALESSLLTRGQIMQQASIAMLAQANQSANVVLILLR